MVSSAVVVNGVVDIVLLRKDAVVTGTLVDSEGLRHFAEGASKRFALRLTLRVRYGRRSFPPLAEVAFSRKRYSFFQTLIHSKPKEPQCQALT